MNMVEQQQYIPAGLPHTGDLAGSHGLSEDRSIAPAGTSAYPEVAPFSAVSSFNIPAPCDSSLLTPISTTSSPPLHQIRKLAPQYPPPPSTPYTQVPTPPGSTKMYHHQPWNSQFDMHNQNPQNGSPMNNQVPVPSDFYMPEDRRTPNPPTEPYFGSFSVSEGPETQPIHNQGPPSYYVDMAMNNQGSMLLRETRHAPMDLHHHRGSHPAALLSQPHSSHYHGVRRASTDDRGYISRGDTARRSSSGSPRRRPATQGSTRVKKPRSSKRQGSSLRSQQHVDPGDEHKNCFGQEVPPPLKDGCPEEERCIFESRWRHRAKRGQDMWDSIQADFEKKFGKRHGKEMLQMKFKRARAKWYKWFEFDDNLLRLAWKQVERNRYQDVLNVFLGMGGSRNMLLSPSDIEAKIVNDFKWEEAIYIENGEDLFRRRRRTTSKKRSSGRGDQGGEIVLEDEMLRVSQTPHNEDDVINQVYGRRDRWDEDLGSVNGEMMDTHLWENRAPMKMETDAMIPSPGEHMARAHSNAGVHPVSGPGVRPVSMYQHSASKAP